MVLGAGRAANATVRGRNNEVQDISSYGNQLLAVKFPILKCPPRLRLRNTRITQFPPIPNVGGVIVTNPIENQNAIFVGGIGDDEPDVNANYVGDNKGEILYPGQSKPFLVDNTSKLSAISMDDQVDLHYVVYLSTVTDFSLASLSDPPAPDFLPPTVSSVSPTNGATSVPTNSDISAIFSETINPDTIGSSSFTISPSVANNVFVDALNPAKVTMHLLAALAFNTVYTMTLTTAISDIVGNVLAANYTWSFTSAAAPPPPDTTPPTIVSKTPIPNATGIGIGSAVTIVFSEAIASGTVNSTNFILTDNLGSSVARTVTLGADGKTVTITPNASLNLATQYTVTVSGSVTDLSNNPKGTTDTWSFTTAANNYTLFYNVSDNNTFISFTPSGVFGSPTVRVSLLAVNTSSLMYNIIPKKVIVPLQKVASAVGNITCNIRDASGNLVIQIGNPLDKSTISTTKTSYSFETAGNTHPIPSGGFLSIDDSGGSDSSNYVKIYVDGTGSYDGTNTELHTVSTGFFGGSSADGSRDLAAQVYI